ncbi:MAG: lamin tail domain-containing protein [Bacteroidota bacterium]
MKKLYFLALAILMTSFTYAQVLSEDFDYGNSGGDLTAVSSGNWNSHSGTTAVAYVAAPTSLSMTDYPSSGVGGHITLTGSNSQDVNSAFTEITTGTVYGSALVNLTSVGSGNYFMHFNSSGFRARVGAQDNGMGDVLFGIGTDSSTLTYGTTAYSLNTTYLLVFSYEIATGVSNLYVLSAVTPTEPMTPEATNTGGTGTAINAISFRQSSNIPNILIDGVRVSTTWNEIMNDSACGVSLGTATYTCTSNTVGDNNDTVTINIPYTGSNPGIMNVTTTSSGVVGGDDPSGIADGTITITGLSEGDAWDITLEGGDCDGVTLSGTVPAAECDPAPSTCFDISGGLELFESVSVVTNSDMDEWTESSGTYTMNGFCGGGCMEESNTWLIFGPLDMSGVSDLSLIFDAAENFDGTELNVQYTSDYSSLCPDSATWTSAQTIADAGSYSIDISGASGTAVFIGIQYLDSDGSFSSWSLSNVSIGAFGSCPSLGVRPTSDCAVCDVALQAATYTCATNTAGDNNDNVTINIPYSGVDNTIVSITAPGATVGGDDPALTADGTITLSGLGEGDAWSITLNGGDCDGTMLSGTVPSSQCDPVALVINEINADPSNNANGEGDANGDGTADFSDDEFVEIYNTSSSSIDLSDYTLSDGATLRHTFPSGTMLPGNSFITVFGGGTPTGISGLVQTASTGALGLNNGGDTITLTNNIAVDIIVEVYGSAGNNQSIGRSPDFTGAFVDHSTIVGNGGALFSPNSENDSTLSTGNVNAVTFSIYPNPTDTGFVTIESPNSDAINVQVFDILGKQVKHEMLTNNTLSVSDLRAGIYIVKITQNDASTTKKLVIR